MKIKSNRNDIPEKILDILKPILVGSEDILLTFRESFNWDLTRTWAVVTNYRLLIVDVLPWRVDVEDFHLRDMNIELKRDNIGPYDIMEFKSKEKDLYEIAVLRNRRKEAQKFLHEVSTNIREQDIYGHRPIHEHDAVGNEIVPGAEVPKLNGKKMIWCAKKLEALRAMRAITEEEYQQEKAKGSNCEL